MNQVDLLIRGGSLVTPTEASPADIAIADGRIAAFGPDLACTARETIDATGMHVFPGIIDSHVHFNEPGRADWEGFATGSRALAAGGGTLFFDMPLNAHPPTINGVAFDQKLAAAQASSLVDFAFWGGLVPGNLDQLEVLAERGVVGFKAFMCNSGMADFPHVDHGTLRAGMKRAARLGRIVALHAESEAMTSQLAARALSNGRTSIRHFLDARPIQAELDAIELALVLAGETACRLHIVHVSCGAGLALIASARRLGLDVTCETCPHYLTLTEDDMLSLGALAKCAPPLRPKSAQDALWKYVISDQVTTIGSDHSPSPPALKEDQNFFKVWGGISGIQHTLPLLITEGHKHRHLPLALIAKLTSLNVARRFNLPPTKGQIALEADADLVLVDLQRETEVRAQDLHYRHRHSPYAGRALTGRVVQTMLRGQTVFKEGRFATRPMGRLVSPG